MASTEGSCLWENAWKILKSAAAIAIAFFLLAASCGPTREPAAGQSASEPPAANQPAASGSAVASNPDASNPPSGNLGSPSSAGSSSSSSDENSAAPRNTSDSNTDSSPSDSAPSGNPENSATVSAEPASPSTSASQPPTTLSPEQQRLASIEARVSTELAVLERRAAEWLPHAAFGIAVQPLEPAGNMLGINENDGFVSASAAKPYWMVSTIAAVGIEAVEPYASAILCRSDNAAAAAVIDATGIDTINEFLHNTAGMSDTFLLSWSFGSSPPASERWISLGRRGFNTTTARDGAAFYKGLYSGELLDPENTEAMLGWMAESSDCGQEFTKPLASRLPDSAQIWHKSGWLPPGCCTVETATLNDFGIVRAPASVPSAQSEIAADATAAADAMPEITYAIAIATSGGSVSYASYLQQSNFIAYASCRIYAAITSEPLECDRSEDRQVTDPGSPPTTLSPATSSTTTSVPVTSIPPTSSPPTTLPPTTSVPAASSPPTALLLTTLPPTSSPPATQQTVLPASPETSPAAH